MHTKNGSVIKTERQRAADEYQMQTLGFEFGNDVARILIGKFPEEFSDQTSNKIQKIVKDGIRCNMKWYRSHDVKKHALDAYEAAYYIALRNAFANYADDCRARAAA